MIRKWYFTLQLIDFLKNDHISYLSKKNRLYNLIKLLKQFRLTFHTFVWVLSTNIIKYHKSISDSFIYTSEFFHHWPIIWRCAASVIQSIVPASVNPSTITSETNCSSQVRKSGWIEGATAVTSSLSLQSTLLCQWITLGQWLHRCHFYLTHCMHCRVAVIARVHWDNGQRDSAPQSGLRELLDDSHFLAVADEK